MRTRMTAIVMLLVASALIPAPPAAAATAQVVSVAGTFVSPLAVMTPGDTLILNNQDVLPHNIVSTVPGQFASATITMGQTAEVEGASDLGPGQYDFVCTLHPWMVGVLVVQDAVGVQVLPEIGTDGTPAVPNAGVTVAGVVPTPTSVTEHAGDLYATSYVQGAVYRLRIGPTGLVESGEIVADGFTNPLGVVIDPITGVMFVSDSHPSSTPGRTTDGRVWAVEPDGTRSVVIDGLPNGRHNTNGMAIHKKRLYITNGNSTDDGVAGGEPEVPPYSGSLLSVPVTARGLGPSGAKVEATGMRNVYDVAFRPGTTEAWMTSNGPDALEPFGEDLLHRWDVRRKRVHFGFPECIHRAGPGGPTDPEAGDNPVIEQPCGKHRLPEVTLGLHVSADGLAFGPAETQWEGSIYIAEFGNFFGEPAGRKIVRVPIGPSGKVTGGPVDVFVGAGPLDLTFAGGNLYVADFAAGHILLVPPDAASG